MTVPDGGTIPYGVFRNELKSRRVDSVHWGWDEVSRSLAECHGAEQAGLGLLALSRTSDIAGCEIIPGISLSVQLLGPGQVTPTHAHAWWHLYVVQSGSGLLTCGEAAELRRITANDIVFIPAWCVHGLCNDGDKPFTTLSVSNMAQQANLANFKPG